MGICDACQSCFDGTATESTESNLIYLHHEGIPDLLNSAEQRCQICARMSKRLKQQVPGLAMLTDLDKQPRKVRPFMTYREFSDFGRVLLEFKACWPAASFSMIFSFHPTKGHSDDHRPLSENGEETKATNTGHKSVLDQARRWLEECCERHSSCPRSGTSHWVPSRLLDVDIPDDQDHLRLLNTAEHSIENAEYNTLSHRWANADFLQLLKHNQDSLSKGFSISALSKTFRDAIIVCRAMKVRYLWIDALCIIQDSPEDWEKESKNMSSVFANGKCNISATEGCDSSNGLFQWRDAILVKPIEINVRTNSLCLGAGTYRLIDTWAIQERTSEAALNQRGWVFQERMLFPRILYFMDGTISWECHAGSTIEGHVNEESFLREYDKSKIGWRGSLQRLKDNKVNDQSRSMPCKDDQCLCNMWHSILAKYTKCEFTYPDDKPWALLGLAKEIERLSGDEYLAGLWQKHLHRQLLWKVETCLKRPLLPRPGRTFPGFSPLSVDMPVTFVDYSMRMTPAFSTEVQGLSSENLRTTSGHTVQDGRLEIRGHLRRVSLESRNSKEGSTAYTLLRQTGEAPVGRHLEDVELTLDALPEAHTDSEHYVLHAGYWGRMAFSWLLLEVVDRKARTYRRLGLVSYSRTEFSNVMAQNRDVQLLQGLHPIDQEAPGWLRGDSEVSLFYLV